MEERMIETDDGWSINVRRYKGDEPVLFVHGMGANSHNFDLNDKYSMSRALSEKGYDSWVIELRGRGKSKCLDPARNDWNFEDFLHRDLRRVTSMIRSETGRKLHWVGHSMGGILGAAYVECYGTDDIGSLVLFGTPLAFEPFQWMLKLWGLVVQVHRVLPTMDQETWGRRMLPLMNRNRKALNFFLRYLANPDNIETDTALDIFDKLVTNEAPGIVLQFSDWVRSGQIRSADKAFSYTDHLGRVTTPTLFISGVHDLMAPAKGTARQMKRLGSENVKQIVLSKKNGFTTDYGHGDLVLGKNAPGEVYPLVSNWFKSI